MRKTALLSLLLPLATLLATGACGDDDSVGTDPLATLQVIITGTGSGVVTSNDQEINCPGDCSAEYIPGDGVTLVATPDADSDFELWSGDCSGSGDCELVVLGDLVATANFEPGVVAPTVGSISVNVSTTGSDFDPDGYTVSVVGGQSQSVGVNASVTFPGLAAGDHDVELAGLASNCTVGSPNPQTVTVSAGGTEFITFTVSCFLRIAFATDRDEPPHEIYVMNADGSRPINLTNDPGQDLVPDISPDGTRIAFATLRDENFEIYVMNADGSNPVNLTNDPAFDFNPAWSPDGSRIAFQTERDGGLQEIYVMNADGSNPVRLTNEPAFDTDPTWSPDGSRIAFFTVRDGNGEIYVMNADGSNPVNLTNDPFNDFDPAWSPDGTRIAFETTRDGNREIYVMNADGSIPVRLTNDPAEDFNPAWSPDGTRIAFDTNRDGNREIYVMNADGSSPVRLTNDPAEDVQPAWSP